MSRSIRGPLIVAIVLTVGVGAGVAGGLWMRSARPTPGAFVDVLALPEGVLAIRAERGGTHDFAEMWVDGQLRWSAFIPTYGGRTGAVGVRAIDGAIDILVLRGDAPASFPFDRAAGRKGTSTSLTRAEADARFPAIQAPLPVQYDAVRRELIAGTGRYPLPPKALAPQPYHAAGGVLWIVTPDALTALSLQTLAPVATVR